MSCEETDAGLLIARARGNRSQRWLARRLGMSQSTLSRIEDPRSKDHRSPTALELVKAKGYLDSLDLDCAAKALGFVDVAALKEATEAVTTPGDRRVGWLERLVTRVNPIRMQGSPDVAADLAELAVEMAQEPYYGSSRKKADELWIEASFHHATALRELVNPKKLVRKSQQLLKHIRWLVSDYPEWAWVESVTLGQAYYIAGNHRHAKSYLRRLVRGDFAKLPRDELLLAWSRWAICHAEPAWQESEGRLSRRASDVQMRDNRAVAREAWNEIKRAYQEERWKHSHYVCVAYEGTARALGIALAHDDADNAEDEARALHRDHVGADPLIPIQLDRTHCRKMIFRGQANTDEFERVASSAERNARRHAYHRYADLFSKWLDFYRNS